MLTNAELLILKDIVRAECSSHEDCVCVACRTVAGDLGAWATIIQKAQRRLVGH